MGGAGFPEDAYSVAPFPSSQLGPTRHVNVVAHEIGHLLSAEHRYGNHAETHLATVMIQGYSPGARPVFSTLSAGYMRAWADEHLGESAAGDGIVGGDAPESIDRPPASQASG